MRRLFRLLLPVVFLVVGLGLAGGIAASAMPAAWRERIIALVEPYAPGMTGWIAGWLARPEVPLPPPRPPIEAVPLDERLAAAGLAKGQPVFIRIIKQSSELELFLKGREGWKRFETYPICRWSGAVGPKLREGDGQSPEGFYVVTRAALNPNSAYHLSFNLGFPNAYDRLHGRTGSFLMVHGACASIGCYAMTDPLIEEIYGLVAAALSKGQDGVPVHVFPYRMDRPVPTELTHSPHRAFWANLKEGWRLFEAGGAPPQAYACPGPIYRFAAPESAKVSRMPQGCTPIAGL